MTVRRLALVTSVILAGLMGCASSHTKPKHSYSGAHSHSYEHGTAHPHYEYEGSQDHGRGSHHDRHKSYRPAPPPIPGRQQDGRYVLPGGLESVCAGGTPPPCVNGQ